MALKRDPNAIQVNGALFLVKDPEASSDDLFNDWRRLGGLGSFTLPAEAGSTTETALMDGAISFANVAGVGNISGAVGALNAGPVHDFMEDKASSGGQVQVAIIRPATKIASYIEVALGDLPAGVGAPFLAFEAGEFVHSPASPPVVNEWAGMFKRVRIPSEHREAVKAAVRSGMVLFLTPDDGDSTADAETAASAANGVASYRGVRTVANDGLWHGVLEVSEEGEWVEVAPGFSADIAVAGSDMGAIVVRNPGRSYKNIIGAVNQWDRGDHQAGGGITSNFQIVPGSQLAGVSPEFRLETDIIGSYETDGTFTV